jgi:hypothetical protein
MIRLAGLASVLTERKLSEYDFETFKKFIDINISKPSMDYDMGSGGLTSDVSIKSTKDAPFKYKYNKRNISVNYLSGSNKLDIDDILNTIYKTDFSKKTTTMK